MKNENKKTAIIIMMEGELPGGFALQKACDALGIDKILGVTVNDGFIDAGVIKKDISKMRRQ